VSIPFTGRRKRRRGRVEVRESGKGYGFVWGIPGCDVIENPSLRHRSLEPEEMAKMETQTCD
jgi:hypothetical protein